MSVRSDLAAGKDVRVIPLAREISIPPATLYAQIARNEIEARRIGRCIVIPNAVGRRLVGMEVVAA